MKIIPLLHSFLCASLLVGVATAAELPRLPEGADPGTQTSQAQKLLLDLPEAYVSMAPEDLSDGIQVGRLTLRGAEEAVAKMVEADRSGEFDQLDSLLIWHDGQLVFEFYNRRGRVDGPHYTMSVTKTMTSVLLARAIEVGLLSIDDLDRPVIDFMPEIDRSKVQSGVESITLRDALMMKSGLRWKDRNFTRTLQGSEYQGQAYFQKLFEETSPVTPESKEYKYAGTDPSMIMMILDIQAAGSAQEFIAEELAGKLQVNYCWEDQANGIPKCGAGSNFTSRALLKVGITMLQGGQFNGEQLLSADYVEQVMAPKAEEGYFFHFHNRVKTIGDQRLRFVSGIGAGGQYLATFPDHNIVVAASSHNKGNIGAPLKAMQDYLLPLFLE